MIIDNLRKEMNAARKSKNSVRAMVLSTLIGEMTASAVMIDGVKTVTDKIAVKILKQSKKNLEENISKGYGSIEAQSTEARIVEEFVPEDVPLMNELETRNAIMEARTLGADSMRAIMDYLKQNYEGRFDGKLASSIAKEQPLEPNPVAYHAE